MLILLEAIILGIIEGVTEFLPISSTGHLILAGDVLHFKDVENIFTVVVQLGSIAGVIWFYRQDLLSKTKGLFARQTEALRFWKLMIIATIPAGIAGVLIESSMDRFTVPGVVATSLILGGIVLWLVDRRPTNHAEKQIDIGAISFKQALLVGLGQCVAIIPGVSRSGATIVSGLATGLNRPTAAKFSFYLSIPVIIAAGAYKLLKHPEAVSQISGGPAALIVGVITAFITALVVISWLMRYISKNNFRPFAIYRIVLGVAILVWLAF